ncbi:MAG: hypothetical protein ABXS91_08620 [Sulfurimonas sp.]
MTKNNSIYDAVSKAIEATINHFIGNDPYFYIAPYFYTGEIDKSCPFFGDNRITFPNYDIPSDDLKTMSHLAPFYRNRIAHNPKNINYYLRALSYIGYGESGFDILCYEAIDCSAASPSHITYEEWLKLDGDYVYTYDQDVEVQTGAVSEAIAYAEST